MKIIGDKPSIKKVIKATLENYESRVGSNLLFLGIFKKS